MGYKKCIVATDDNELFETIKKQIGELLPIVRFHELNEFDSMLDAVSTENDEIIIADNFFFGCKAKKYMKFLLNANQNTKFFFCVNCEMPIHYGLHLKKTLKANGSFGLSDFKSKHFLNVLNKKVDSYFPKHIKECLNYNVRDISQISEHEIEIADLFSKGWSEKEIASKFSVSTSSISTQLTHFKRKAGLENRFDIFKISQIKDIA